MTAAEYEDFEGKDGTSENSGGTEQVIYFAPLRDFETIQPTPAFGAGAAVGDSVIISGDHVMKTGKKLTSMNLNMDSGQFDAAMVGERGGMSVSPSFEGMYIGSPAAQLEFQRNAKEDYFIAFVPLADGTVLQIGDAKRYALFSADFSSGKAEEGLRALKVMIKSVSKSVWIYEGVLPLTPAV